jgi:elongation factor G
MDNGGKFTIFTNYSLFREKITRTKEIPADFQKDAEKYRTKLIEAIADVDESILEKVLDGVEPTPEELKAAIRKANLAHKFTPVLMGTALKNKGVQPMLDGVVDYLPNPMESYVL